MDVDPRSAAATTSDEFEQEFTCPNDPWEPVVTGSAISFAYTLTLDGFDDPFIRITG